MAATNRALGIQYLRALAALMVVYFHTVMEVPQYSAHLAGGRFFDVQRLQGGVHIFFVISGFIMMVTAARSSPGEFLLRRLIRVVPLYWILTTSLVLLAVLPPHFFVHLQITPEYYLKSILFIPYAAPSGMGQPLLVPGWTLNIEMFFYVLFAVALFWRGASRILIASGLLLAMVAIGVTLRSPMQVPEIWTLTRPWMVEFIASMWIAQLYIDRRLALPRWLCGALVVVGFVVLVGRWNGAGPGIPSAAIVLGAVAWEQRYRVPKLRLGLLLGDASYSLYLSHSSSRWVSWRS